MPFTSHTPSPPTDVCQVDIGLNLLVTGLAVHVVTLLLFALLGVRFALAVHQRRDRLEGGLVVYNTSRFKVFICGKS